MPWEDGTTTPRTGAAMELRTVNVLQYDTTGATGASAALQALIDLGARHIVIPPGKFKADAAVFYDQQDGNASLRIMATGCVFVAQTTLPTVAEWDTFATGRSVATGCKFFLFPSTLRAALSAGVVTVTGNDVAGSSTYPTARNGISPHLIVDGGTWDADLLTNYNGGFIFANRGGAVELRSVHMSSARMLCCSSGYVDAMKMMNCGGWGATNMSATHDAALFYQIDSGDAVYIYGCKTDNYILCANLTSCNGAHITSIVGGGVKLTNCHGIKIDANHSETATNIAVVPRIIYDIRDSHVTIDTSFDYMPENQTTLGAIYLNDSGGEGQQSTVDVRNYFGRYWNAATDSTSGYAIYINNFNDRSQINVYFSGMQMSAVGVFATAYAQFGLTIGGNAANEPTLAAALAANRDMIGSGSFQIYKYALVAGQSGQNAAMSIGIGQIGNLAGLYKSVRHVLPTFYDAEAYGSGTLVNGTVYAYAAALCNTLPDGTIQYGQATAEWTQTAGAGGAQGFEMYLPSAGNGATLVLWRKTATGVLAGATRYVVIPVGTAASRFLDTGANINGIPWITTGVPIPNTVASTNSTFEALYQSSTIITAPAGGTFTSTPGAVTTVNIPHSLFLTPTKFSAQAGNAAAGTAVSTRGMSVTADATNVILTFTSALPGGTVLAWNWAAGY